MSQTPTTDPPSVPRTRRPSSQTRSRPSTPRPRTPLRPPSRSSFRGSFSNSAHLDSATPLDALEKQFAELADSMADLEANMTYLSIMHESLARFGESFGAFLYGLNMNAFCVDFPEVSPVFSSAHWFHRLFRKGHKFLSDGVTLAFERQLSTQQRPSSLTMEIGTHTRILSPACSNTTPSLSIGCFP
jgi:DASH complex subunit DAM1